MVTSVEESEAIPVVFNRLRHASSKYKQESLHDRKQRLRSLRKWIKRNREDIQKAIFQDFKKPSTEVDATEIFPVLDEIQNGLANLDQWAKSKKIDAPLTMLGTRSEILYEPKGLCLIISPWNYPFNLTVGPMVSALAAGNNIIVKPSELTPHTTSLIKKMCAEVFASDTVVVCAGGPEVSQELLKFPFDHIFFTGSPTIGKIVMRAAAEHLTSVTLELGGKSPTIVSSTAKLQEAAKRISVAKFINSGQMCIAPDYVLVHETVANNFIINLKDQIQRLFSEKGGSISESPHYARMVNQNHFLRVNDILQDALNSGAKVDWGGSVDQEDRFVHPTILSNVSMESRIMEEEIFGPLLPIIVYSSIDDVIKIINNKPKPLALYFFGNDKNEQGRIERETSSGAICVNDCAIHFLNHNLPFGGVNNSGIGKSHGYHGFLAFSNEKPVVKQRSGLTSFSLFYPPYTPGVKRLINWLLKLF